MKLDEANRNLSDYANLIDSLNKKVTDMEAGMNKAIRAGKNIDDLEERIEEMEDKLKKKMKEKNSE
jgi:peptidoglycan hydrolase CwlO-like protein